jgi:hypothetical protein
MGMLCLSYVDFHNRECLLYGDVQRGKCLARTMFSSPSKGRLS